MSIVRIPKPWILFVSLTVFIFLSSGCRDTSGVSPTIIATNQVQIETSSAPVTSTTPLPGKSTATSNTLVLTYTPTFAISSSATVVSAGEITVTEEKKTYSQISPADLYAKPEDYDGKRFMLDGVVLGYGYRKFEGKDVYVIQVGVIDYPRPIIVLGFLPNPTLGMHDGIIIGGTGGGAFYGVDPTDPKSYTPVILGEWYECNLPWDQWKYPYEFWNLIQLEGVIVN